MSQPRIRLPHIPLRGGSPPLSFPSLVTNTDPFWRNVSLCCCCCGCPASEADGWTVFNEGIHRLYAKKASECAVEAMRDALPGSPVLRLVCATLQEVLSNGSSVLALEQTGKALEMFRREMMRQTDVIPEESFMAGLLLCTLHASLPSLPLWLGTNLLGFSSSRVCRGPRRFTSFLMCATAALTCR